MGYGDAPMAQQRKPRIGAPSSTARGGGRRRFAVQVATVAITLGFSYLAIRGIDVQKAGQALRRSEYWWLAPALVAFGLGNLARALRWRSLFAPGRRPAPGPTTNAMMIGYFYNNILPSRAGEAARVLVLKQRSDSPAVEITGTVVLERVFDVLAILLIFFVAGPWLPHVSWFGTAALVTAGLVISTAIAAAVLAVFDERPLRLLLRPLARFPIFSGERLERTIAEIAHGLAGLRKHRVALEALSWTVLAWLMSILCAYLVMQALRLQLPFTASVLVMVAVAVSMILPAAPASVGVFEGATLIALHAYGVNSSTALPYALVLHLVNFLPFLIVGAALLHYNSRHVYERHVRIPSRTPQADTSHAEGRPRAEMTS